MLAVAGMFYIGHGLHESGGGVPQFSGKANAAGITIDRFQDGQGYSGSYVITSSPDGKTVYNYGPSEFRQFFQREAYLGKLSAP